MIHGKYVNKLKANKKEKGELGPNTEVLKQNLCSISSISSITDACHIISQTIFLYSSKYAINTIWIESEEMLFSWKLIQTTCYVTDIRLWF